MQLHQNYAFGAARDSWRTHGSETRSWRRRLRPRRIGLAGSKKLRPCRLQAAGIDIEGRQIGLCHPAPRCPRPSAGGRPPEPPVMGSGAIVSLQTSYAPARAGNLPKASDFLGPAIMTTGIPAGGALVEFPNEHQPRAILVLAEQPPLHRSKRDHHSFFAKRDSCGHTDGRRVSSVHGVSAKGRVVDAEAIKLGPRQQVQVLELHRFDEIIEFTADAHRGNEGCALAIGLGDVAGLDLRDLLRRDVPRERSASAWNYGRPSRHRARPRGWSPQGNR